MDILRKVDKRSITYHCGDGEGYNDFAAWIRDVFRDEELASEVAGMQWWEPRSKLIRVIQERISELKSRVEVGVDAL